MYDKHLKQTTRTSNSCAKRWLTQFDGIFHFVWTDSKSYRLNWRCSSSSACSRERSARAHVLAPVFLLLWSDAWGSPAVQCLTSYHGNQRTSGIPLPQAVQSHSYKWERRSTIMSVRTTVHTLVMDCTCDKCGSTFTLSDRGHCDKWVIPQTAGITDMTKIFLHIEV